jgi:transposase-like protein
MRLCGRGFRKLYTYRCRVSFFLFDETAVMVGGFPAWVWMAYEPSSRRILGLWLSWTRNSLQAESFLRTLVRLYGRHPVWYIDACKSLSITGIMAPYSDREGYTVLEG